MLTRLNHYGETTDVFDPGEGFKPQQTLGSKVQLDAEIGYRFSEPIYDVHFTIRFNGRFVFGRIRAAF